MIMEQHIKSCLHYRKIRAKLMGFEKCKIFLKPTSLAQLSPDNKRAIKLSLIIEGTTENES
jgi:hypothetical protein